MSATRLLVIGAVRIFQPVHGYFVRRELISWGVESWANVNPGSIYNALRSLTRDGLLAEKVTEVSGSRPARTTYELTMDGENAYQDLLRRALWRPEEGDPTFVLAGLCFLTTLRRADAIEALEARESNLTVHLKALDQKVRYLVDSRTVPAHTFESFEFGREHIRAERTWVRAALKRIADDHYIFSGEPGVEADPLDGRWPGPLDKPRRSTKPG